MKAFKPKKSIFMRSCMNCEYGKKVAGAGGSALGYICVLKDGTQRLFGTHECDVDVDGTDKNQINWFEDFKEEEKKE